MIKLIKSSFHHESETKRALADFVLRQDVLSMNEQCRAFEEAFAARQECRHAVFVGNGSVANLLLVQTLLNQGRLRRGDRVGVSALTWPTNVMPLIQLGLEPVAIDCELDTLNISPRNLETHVSGLRALFLTNVLGFCDDLPALRDLCDDQSVLLLEDNCEALGSSMAGTLLGNFSLASTFSFFVGHHLSTIEGGMICTDDEELHDGLLISRAHGWDRNLAVDRQAGLRAEAGVDDFHAKYTFYDLASNFRPTEINGFIGNRQIPYWDEIVGARAANFERFQQAMTGNGDVHQYDLTHMDTVSNFAMPVVCRTPELARKYRAEFEAAGVEIRPVIAGDITRQPFYRKYVRDTAERPVARLVHTNGFYFGNNPELTGDELATLCDLVCG
ncbi:MULTISPECIES: DegT/DnrJ/EryC1/StrS aminotransferase family protein [Streptomyces]|uniref:DegT/DnrJ/EryC1/StrS aminotransferase family protein n=1 Tax=Streptomyces mirabilis TaxID=68239 RepID=A0ABU3UTK3_9ACTN|nr:MULTISPECIES: DegT/DnrJ/EryC1/StrS aminotransferase family protein [Streptomyces]MDU8997259.1 DegT/DnrJ/EryC1/StrS aminotransferase family protein [Streptomyces mirabilis]QDN87846.1 DegT/DnrJ/EryC1/StrS aminotransferase family protein [Streptomyces sp. RLB3-6]QDO08680.1 DegT/DnrJ/EryC1/StrS aminotransferase family protein [Streptomyces sp. S1D4-23]